MDIFTPEDAMILTLTKRIPSSSHNAPCDDDGEHWPAGQQFKLDDVRGHEFSRFGGHGFRARIKPTSFLVTQIGGEEVQVAIPIDKFVELFGVLPPASHVAVPRTIGDVLTFEAHGRQWQLKKLRRDCWFFRAMDQERGRFGDLGQIRQDVLHVLETGVLPREKESVA